MEEEKKETPLKAPPHFVLIHGISGGSWCWYKMKSLMYNSGYMVTCIDLKGAGIDPSDPNTILSFDHYNKPLLDFFSSLPLLHHHKVILVGHSAGGLSITQATHKFPNKISVAVYVAATMLKNGFLTEQDVKDGAPDLSEYGDAYDLEFGLGSTQPPTTGTVKKELQRKLLYHMSPPEDYMLASMLLRPGPIYAIQSAQFPEGNEDVEKVPRVYIKTMYDRVIKPEQQDNMIAKWTPSQVYVLESDHSPNFSSPFALFGLLVKIAASIGGT
ncbi:methylesterase 17-like [Cynara cardunculus var. scolymus]|uniref:methylesterase 17-like n=1 Tax=Cynara cardunculus var. scolymus TaxID=59895 RepID=UPI000D62AD50|nr:methylesterase 17-like [Cynara cardunculus var. scolymus]